MDDKANRNSTPEKTSYVVNRGAQDPEMSALFGEQICLFGLSCLRLLRLVTHVLSTKSKEPSLQPPALAPTVLFVCGITSTQLSNQASGLILNVPFAHLSAVKSSLLPLIKILIKVYIPYVPSLVSINQERVWNSTWVCHIDGQDPIPST